MANKDTTLSERCARTMRAREIALWLSERELAELIEHKTGCDALLAAVEDFPTQQTGEPSVDYAARLAVWALSNVDEIRAAIAKAKGKTE